MFGRSFNQIGNAITNKLIDFNDEFERTGKLADSWKNTDSIWKRLYGNKSDADWIKNSAGEIVTGANIDTFMPKMDDTGYSSLLQNLIDIDAQVKSGTTTWQDYFSNLKDNQKWQIDFVQNTDLQKASLDDVKVAQDNARQAAIAHNAALKQQTLGAKATKVAMSALATVGNMLLVTALMKGAEWLLTYNKRLEESRQAMIELGEEAAKTNKSVTNLVDQYRKLGEDGKIDTSDQETARSIQEQLTELVGGQAKNLDLVNGKYDEQIEKLKNIQNIQANKSEADLLNALDASKESLTKKAEGGGMYTSMFGSGFAFENENQAVKTLLKSEGYDKYLDEVGVDSYFKINTDSMDGIIESYEAMSDLRNIIADSYENEIQEGGALEDFYNNLNKRYEEMTDAVTKYQNAQSNYDYNEAVQLFNKEQYGEFTGALIENEEQIKSWTSAMLDSDVSDGVKDKLVELAKSTYPDFGKAIDDVRAEKIKLALESNNLSDATTDEITDLLNEATVADETKQSIVELARKKIEANAAQITTSGDIQNLLNLIAVAGGGIEVLDDFKRAKRELDSSFVGPVSPATRSIVDGTYTFDWDEYIPKSPGNITNGYPPKTTSSGSGSSSSKNDPKYSDPTDAIINRINAEANQLAKQGEIIESNLDLIDSEKDYAKAIDETNNLISNRTSQIDALKLANSKLHNEADKARNSNSYSNEESWFDADGDETEAFHELKNSLKSDDAQEKLQNEFNKIQKFKKAYLENEKLIQDLTKENIKSIEDISDIASKALENHFDERNEISERWIQTQTDFDQLAIDGQIEAYARMVRNNREFLKEIEKNEHLSAEERDRLWKETSDKIVDYQLEAYNLVKKAIQQYGEEVEKGYDIRISRLNSESSLLSTHFDLINAISEEQHNLNKELAEAEVAGAKMNKIERQTLFTKEEHAKLTDKLNGLLGDAVAIQSNYLSELETATKETIEEITNNYERQYELKMKEYEVVKAELALVKAEQKLKNVENEKSVRTWDGTKWIYEADFQDVVDAKLAVEDAKYAVWQAQTSQAQQTALNAIDSTADSLETQKNLFAETLEELSGETKITGQQLTEALKYIAEVDLPTFEKIIEQFGDSLSEAFDVDVDSVRGSAGGSSSSGMPLNSSHLNYSRTVAKMQANSAAYASASDSKKASLHEANANLAAGIGATFNGTTGHWEIKGTKLYANGSKSTPKGLGIFDEHGIGSEYVLTKDGILHNFNMGDKVFNPKMGDNLYEAAQIDWKRVSLADFGGLASIDNSIRNMSSDTYYNVNGVNINSEEGGEIKGFVKFLKAKKI